MSEWKEYKLEDFALINPTERLSKGSIAKKIAMEFLQPFTKKIPSFSFEEYKGGTKFRNGDTIMARITPSLENGKTSFVDILDEDEIGFGSTEFIVLRERKNISDKDFIFYLTISPIVRNTAIKSMTGSSGRQRVQTDVVKQHKILVPNLLEQKQIAEILTSLDDKIDLLHRQNKTLEAMAETLFRQWFIEEAEEDWEEGKLQDLLEIKYGKDHKHLKSGNIPVYGSGGIMRYVNQALYTKESILIPRKGTLSNLFYLDKPFWSVDTMFYSLIKKQKYGFYCFLLLKTKNLESMNVGSAVPSLTTKLLNSINIVIPPIDIIREFDKIVSDMFGKIKFNKKQIQTLEKSRDTLLPKLMNGEIKVEENE